MNKDRILADLDIVKGVLNIFITSILAMIAYSLFKRTQALLKELEK